MVEKKARGARLLERVTAASLVLVLVVLGWMVLRAFELLPAGLASTEGEVVGVLVLLSVALVLVSVVALFQSR